MRGLRFCHETGFIHARSSLTLPSRIPFPQPPFSPFFSPTITTIAIPIAMGTLWIADTLTIRHRVPPLWKSSSSASSFTLQVDLKLPTQDIPYIPGAAEVLKFAWVQYISLFILLAYFMSFVRAFVFRYQVVETFVASDTRPPQKVHQF